MSKVCEMNGSVDRNGSTFLPSVIIMRSRSRSALRMPVVFAKFKLRVVTIPPVVDCTTVYGLHVYTQATQQEASLDDGPPF